MDKQIEQYFEGALNTAQRLEMLKRVEADSELKEQFIAHKNSYALLALSDTGKDEEESRHSYSRFMSKIRRQQVGRFVLRGMGYAATLALLVATTYWFTARHFESQTVSDAVNTLYVPAGQRVKLTLQDGTTVWLNAQSTLTYPALFAEKERKVSIIGEAFFDVAKNPERPFIVTSQGVEMKVLGTQFNVDSYPGQGHIQTSLIEGSLQISIPQSGAAGIILRPDERATIENGRLTVSTIPHADQFLWKEGIYSFDNELLIDILKKLELHYDVKIVVNDPSIYTWEYTGKFKQRDGVEKILQMIQRIHKFSIRKDEINKTIILDK